MSSIIGLAIGGRNYSVEQPKCRSGSDYKILSMITLSDARGI